MNFDWAYFWQSLLTPSPRFLSGLALTIIISVVAMALALVLGLVIALMGRSRFLPFKIFASGYVWIIRGTPLLVQLVIIYTGFAAAGLFRFGDADIVGVLIKGAVQAAIVGLMLNESAYISEIVRSGLESVDRGQNEAALSLGMTPLKSMRQIIVPQAIRVMVPPLGNSFNGLMKSTSILSVIGVAEMFQVGSTMSSRSTSWWRCTTSPSRRSGRSLRRESRTCSTRGPACRLPNPCCAGCSAFAPAES
jgi:polar amino acid transport system permease protein